MAERSSLLLPIAPGGTPRVCLERCTRGVGVPMTRRETRRAAARRASDWSPRLDWPCMVTVVNTDIRLLAWALLHADSNRWLPESPGRAERRAGDVANPFGSWEADRSRFRLRRRGRKDGVSADSVSTATLRQRLYDTTAPRPVEAGRGGRLEIDRRHTVGTIDDHLCRPSSCRPSRGIPPVPPRRWFERRRGRCRRDLNASVYEHPSHPSSRLVEGFRHTALEPRRIRFKPR